jgi:hypothetical protein
MIPSIEQRQIRPCEDCYFYGGTMITITGNQGDCCKLYKFLRRDGLCMRFEKPCDNNFTLKEIQELINNHNKGELR